MGSLSKSELLKRALELVEEEDIELLFDLLNKRGIKAASLSKLKKEFIKGVHKTDNDYTDRLKMALKEVLKDELPSNSLNAAKSRFLIPALNEGLNLGLIKSLLDNDFENFKKLFEGTEWTNEAKYEYELILKKLAKKTTISLDELESLCRKVFKEVRFAYEEDELCSWHFLDREILRIDLLEELKKVKDENEFPLRVFLFPHDEVAMTDKVPEMFYSWHKDWADEKELTYSDSSNLAELTELNTIRLKAKEKYIKRLWEKAIQDIMPDNSADSLKEALRELEPATRILYQKVELCEDLSKVNYFLNTWLDLGPWPSPTILVLIVPEIDVTMITNENVWCCNPEDHYETITQGTLSNFCRKEGKNYMGYEDIFEDASKELSLKEVLCHEKLVYKNLQN